MLKSDMHKHIFIITLILLCLLITRPAEARLTLGVVVGPNDAAGEISSVQANSLASVLAQKLNEEVVVRELSDSKTLLNWLDRFAMLDLALFPIKNMKGGLGGFVQVGPVDEQGHFNLVFRQGVAVDLPQRIDRVVSEPGFEPWRPKKIESPDESLTEDIAPSLPEPPPLTKVTEQVDLQGVVSPAPDRTWPQQEVGVYSGIPPHDEVVVKNLVFGVFPDPKGLLSSKQQTEELLLYLERSLPASVKIREFTSIETFAEWFMRYRMVDVAILPPSVAKANLGNEYIPVANLVHLDSQGKETSALVIMRHGQNEEMLGPLQRAFLDMMQTAEGQTLFADLSLKDILAPEDISGRQVVFDYQPGPATEAKKPLVELAEKPVVKIAPPAIEYSEPAEPMAPEELAAAVLPILPKVNEPVANISEVEGVESEQLLPEFGVAPVEPLAPELMEVMGAPEGGIRKTAPAKPEMIQPVEIVPPILPSDSSGVVEPTVVASMPEKPEVLVPLPEPAIIPPAPEPPVAVEIPDDPSLSLQPPDPPLTDALPVVEMIVPTVPSGSDTVDEPVSEASAPELAEITPPEIPELPAVVESPGELEQTETIVSDVDVVSEEQSFKPVVVTENDIETETFANEEPVGYEQQELVSEALTFADAASPGELSEAQAVLPDENTESWSEEEFAEVLGEDMVAAVVAQPDLPPEFRPSGVPVVRPGRVARPSTVSEDQILVASLPEPIKKVEPPRPPKLLPDEEPEPGVVYIVPFVGVMVPEEVNTRVFDQFVDQLNQEGETLDLQFVILKDGLQRVTPEWLSVRKYVTGEIYAYIEDSSCCSTDLRTKVRLTYRHPNQRTAAFDFEYPVRRFFEHDRSTIEVERTKISDDIAKTLSGELIKALQN